MIDAIPILTLFGINLETLPDETFTEGASTITAQGDTTKSYFKDFKDNTFFIFERIEVRDIGGICNNIFFTAHGLKKVNIYTLKKLMNKLFEIYGPDTHNKGKWITEDFSYFNDKEFYGLFGRTWTENTNYPCQISIDREDNLISLVIWGVNHIEME